MSDSIIERRALREKVLPRFREHCRNLLALDVRVSKTGAKSSTLLLINYLIILHWFLLYGSAALPSQVEVSEYQLLLQACQQVGVCTQQLERVYQRDENAVPPSYRQTASVESAGSLLVINADILFKFTLVLITCFRFSTNPMIEFTKAMLYRAKTNVYFLHLQADPFEQSVPTPSELLSQLCDVFLPALLSSHQLLLYSTTTECDRRHGYTTARRRAYADALCQQVFSDLMAMTDSSNVCRLRGKASIRAYVKQIDQQNPLVVTGGPCTGKTVLVAHCAQYEEHFTELEPDSYICRSPDKCSYNTGHDPTSDCSQSQHVCDGDPSAPQELHSNFIKVGVSLFELEGHLASLLTQLPSSEHPLILILDGLDQLENNVGSQIIGSLPSHLPDAVKLIITVSSKRTGLLQAIKSHYSQLGGLPCSVSSSREEEAGYACIQLQSVDRKQCIKLLESLLSCSGRRVTSGQQALVNQALSSCRLPLYFTISFLFLFLDSDVNESSLPDSVHSSISALLEHLEQKHGSSLVARAVSYVSLSRTGLSETELVDLLSHDHPECEGKISQVDVERLLIDLKNFLIRRPMADSQVLFWVSRHFKLVGTKKYLSTHEARKKIHSEMVDYFSGRRAVGNEKPFVVNCASEAQNESESQPFIFSVTEDVCWVNMRKILELPHHLQQSGCLEEMEEGLLMSLGFHQAMLRAGLLSDLVTMLEADEGSTKFLRERWLVASILKSSACFLHSSPPQLPTVMESSLLPYLDVFPAFERYIREIQLDRRKKRKGVGLVLSSRPNPKNKTISVAETVCTECGVVAEIIEDGSAWIWKGLTCDVVKLSLSLKQQEVKFAGVKSSSQFLLLSTQCKKLFVWDVEDPERLTEVKESLKTESESNQTQSMVEGFVSCEEKLCIWWKKERYFSVFDISSNTLAHFQCQSSVMCLVASFNSFSVYCGQADGTVSIFDLTTGNLLGCCLNSAHRAVIQVILCEEEQEMVCVDENGSLALWDIADKEQPPILIRENFDHCKPSSVLNTDFSKAANTLLVCQSQQVTLWNMCNWEMCDQFLAPQGKSFTKAVLSLDGHLFLALLDHYPLILVWRVSTGECVLSLQTNTQPLTLLRTASDIICVSQNGCLTVWDAEMINSAGTATRMRSGVKGVVVDQTGKSFYTTDGLENVWKWSLDASFPKYSFVHEGPVEKMELSPNGSFLLSLSGEEIYIWQTETGENIARISGGGAADVLITPNSKFGVSISKHGLSHVWKLPCGGIVCSIHQYLSDAQVSAEGTFLVGLHHGDLLAASLWSGSISKRFSCTENSEYVVTFHTLLDHPDFVVVLTASGAVYTWKLSEETVCRHFQLPDTFHCQPQDFQMSPNGSYALLSTDNNSINVLDLSRVRLCSFKVEGPVIKACLDKTGCYMVYVCNPGSQEKSCACDLHSKFVLTVVRLSDRERIGRVCLHKNPSTMTVSKQQGVFVGFIDGSVGVFSILDADKILEVKGILFWFICFPFTVNQRFSTVPRFPTVPISTVPISRPPCSTYAIKGSTIFFFFFIPLCNFFH
uniref:NWD1/2-like winged helix-turn-helix domain-containing protein n=1 Tax=Cyprinodon variegatus TaxID=28743 RepID=A0A3Q2CKH6_CYPVA